MTEARRLVPGRTHAVTRRTARRCRFLKPTPEVKAILGYTLGLAITRHPIDLHALQAHVNHNHVVNSDAAERSRLSDFYREFHSLSARALNAMYGRGENLWCVGSFDNCEITDTATLEEQLLYLWTNVVKDGLVPTPEAWPGLSFLPEDFGRTFTFRRPKGAFFGGRRPRGWRPARPPARAEHRAEHRARREAAERRERARERRKAKRKGRPLRRRERKERAPLPPGVERGRSTLPEEITFTIARPPGYDAMTLDEVRQHFRKLLDARVADIHAERKAEGLTHFIGVEAVLAEDPLDSVGDTYPTFARNPRVACNDSERRKVLLAGLRAWRQTYRAALLAWRGGDREVAFPHGSYALPRFHGARVAAMPTGPPDTD